MLARLQSAKSGKMWGCNAPTEMARLRSNGTTNTGDGDTEQLGTMAQHVEISASSR